MNNNENMSDRYKTFGYEITEEHDFVDKKLGITPEIRDHIQELYFEAHEPERGTVKKLKILIKKYPHIPHFKSFLTAVYDSKGDKIRVYECNKLIQKEHPDYLFGKINLAAQYFEQEEYGKIPDVLGKQMEIQSLYPERKIWRTAA